LLLGIIDQRQNNLADLLDGFSLLDSQDKERIIRVVDTLDSTDKMVKKEIFNDTLGNGKKREQGAVC
jgi:hypothetical protein